MSDDLDGKRLDPQRLERAAEAVCKSMHGNPGYISEYYAAHARAAILAYLGETHVDVPIEPTQAMIDAAHANGFEGNDGHVRSDYSAMIAAAQNGGEDAPPAGEK